MSARALAVLATTVAASAGACSSVSTVRVQGDGVAVPAGMRPIAIIHAEATTAYLLFIPLPGHVTLDRVVNRMLIATARALGADKVINISVRITPDTGIWTLLKVAGWRTAEASGTAVVMEPVPERAGTP